MILGATLERKFAKEIQELCPSLVAATVEQYNLIRTEMLPTPAKSHYTFNLRDLARVIQGVLRADAKEVSAGAGPRIVPRNSRRGLARSSHSLFGRVGGSMCVVTVWEVTA